MISERNYFTKKCWNAISNVPTNLEKITSIIIPYFPILTVFGQFDIKTVNRPDGGHNEIFQPNSCIITTAMKPVYPI
jgi:hypothetical protein